MSEVLESALRRGLANGPALLGGFVFELAHPATVAQFFFWLRFFHFHLLKLDNPHPRI